MFITHLQVLVQFICSIFVAFITARCFQPQTPLLNTHNRFGSLDGLRGLLAFFVFQHHAFIWYFLIRNQRWAAPQHLFVKNLGEVSVVLFFMITGLLFIHKIRTATEPIHWRKVFTSRARRLIPLYWFAILVLCLFIFIHSHGDFRQPVSSLLQQLGHWLSFNLFLKQDHLDINGFNNTHLILAGVTWTLKYEWLFYLSLPLIAFIMGKKQKSLWLLIGIIAFYFLIMHALSQRRLCLVLAFLLGGLASKLNDYPMLSTFTRTKVASTLLVVGLLLTYLLLPKAFSYMGVIIIGALFILMATGANVFGLLEHPTLKHMRDISYSVYLLHGLVLFCCFYMMMGLKVLRAFSAFEYTVLISLLSGVVIMLSTFTYRFIEQKFMMHTNK